MSSVIENPRTKEKCQIFTPSDVVKRMLDLAGYDKHLYGKSVLENSCGDGQFLSAIVERYIIDAFSSGLSVEAIRAGLEKDIVAYELDKNMVCACKKRLTEIANKHQVKNVKWNIKCADFLKEKVNKRFDYIIGNPPYVAYSDLSLENRVYLKANYSTCKKGKFDYSYAFIEKSYLLLKDNGGVLVYIIPSSIFKNVFASELRNLVKADLTDIIDYPKNRIFQNALVSPAIIKLVHRCSSPHINYTAVIDGTSNSNDVEKDALGDKWFFFRPRMTGRRVGNYFKVCNSIATLYNDAFVLKNGKIDGTFYCTESHRIELSILKRTTSPKSKKYVDIDEYIIFPYYFNSTGKLMHYSEQEMTLMFPQTVSYLSGFMEELMARKSDKTAKWYEYGRTQALQHMNQQMIMISSIISDSTEAYLLDEGEIPYSGLYIVQTGSIPLDFLLQKLNSNSFKRYISKVGINVSGTSKRISVTDIENFRF